MPKISRLEIVRRAQHRAAMSGHSEVSRLPKPKYGRPRNRVWPFRWTANYSGRCTDPVYVSLYGRPDWKDNRVHEVTDHGPTPTEMEMKVRCRRCEACLKARAQEWRVRAEREWRHAENRGCRTWFGTLTFAPDQRVRATLTASARLRRGGTDMAALTADEQFVEIHKETGKHVTNMVKRLREKYSGTIRLLCVTEAHKDNFPHYHVLIHEDVQEQLRWKTLSDEWHAGFSVWKLVKDARAASYCCKYLAKSSVARVRASLNYGEKFALEA